VQLKAQLPLRVFLVEGAEATQEEVLHGLDFAVVLESVGSEISGADLLSMDGGEGFGGLDAGWRLLWVRREG
jgi:hypothetical protein